MTRDGNDAAGTMDFRKLVLTDVVKDWPEFGKLQSQFAAGSDLMEYVTGARPNFALYYIVKAGMFPETPHRHYNDEYLMFLSADPSDLKNLGATVEIAFDENWTKSEFSSTCLVRFPAGVQHCPIHFKSLERPFLFGHFWPMGEAVNILPPQ